MDNGAADDRRRLSFLARACEILASSLDYETTLSNLARLAVPELADWCAVSIAEPDGTIRQLAVAHADPEKTEWALELNRRVPPDPNARSGVPQVLRTGKSEF